ncbi:hypothetical protein RB595_003126 [Gaeumannomyces hyphopodioides]
MRHGDGRAENTSIPARILGRLQGLLPPLTFITCHYAYFVGVCIVSSLVFWGSSGAGFPVGYVDSLFLVVSAMTGAGLNTVNLSQLNTWQQTMLFLLIMFGGPIWVSIWTVLARKRAFERRFNDIVRAAEESTRGPYRCAASTATAAAVDYLLSRVAPRPRSHSFRPALEGPRRPRSTHGVNKTQADAAVGLGPETGGLPTGGDVAFETSTPPGAAADEGRITFAYGVNSTPLRKRPPRRTSVGPGAASDKAEENPPRAGGGSSGVREFLDTTPAGRNGQFHSLSSEEREKLGGTEYRALKVLAAVVPLYFALWQLVGCLALGAWMAVNMPDVALANGIDPWWLGIFNGVSAFNNSGMSLLDANMIPFEQATFVLVTMALLILAGNTAYPIFLRLIFWAWLELLKMTTDEDAWVDFKATLEFILRYPRRVYTNLFPSRPTWWLLFMIVLLNSIDWVAFELLNLGNPVIESIPRGARVLDGLFQAIAVRSGGFYVVPIAKVYIGLQFLYVIMMYVSAYPVVITMRHSNVYEERSLGIYAGEQEPPSFDPEVGSMHVMSQGSAAEASGTKRRPAAEFGQALRRTFTPWHGVGVAGSNASAPTRISFISQQIHGQLAHDISWLVLAVLVITTIETGHFLGDPVAWSVFNVIFEVVSAYGCVGISVGVPFDSFSFCGGWHPSARLVLCLVMLRGRHRGLPVALDGAVRLPGEQLHMDEEEDHQIRRTVSMTTGRRLSVSV